MRDESFVEMKNEKKIDEMEDEERGVVVGGEEDIGGRLAISTATEAL